MKRFGVWILVLLLAWTGFAVAQAERSVIRKAFSAGNMLYMDIAAGDIDIAGGYAVQNGAVFAHKNKITLTGESTAHMVTVRAGANVTVTINELFIQSTSASPFSVESGGQSDPQRAQYAGKQWQ